MEKTTSFKGLIVWQKAHLLALSIYKVTKNYPKEECSHGYCVRYTEI